MYRLFIVAYVLLLPQVSLGEEINWIVPDKQEETMSVSILQWLPRSAQQCADGRCAVPATSQQISWEPVTSNKLVSLQKTNRVWRSNKSLRRMLSWFRR